MDDMGNADWKPVWMDGWMDGMGMERTARGVWAYGGEAFSMGS